MSADLQSAGTLFGAWPAARGQPRTSPAALFARTEADKAAQPALFAAPLPAELAVAITPLVAGTGKRNELLDIALDGRRVCAAEFALPLATPGNPCAWHLPPQGDTLHAELERRQRRGSPTAGQLYGADCARRTPRKLAQPVPPAPRPHCRAARHPPHRRTRPLAHHTAQGRPAPPPGRLPDHNRPASGGPRHMDQFR
ncbi:MAG: hypothetical protein IPH54_15440 [Rhodoferax sp.]|nr:hypothetical protein [Rhodoferax sp.]